jgi:hypothetical protein
MAVSKQIGHGAAVAWDAAGSTTWATIGLIESATPPTRKRARIEGTALEDTLEVYAPGIEEYSEFTFTHFWHPSESAHEALVTSFDAKGIANWKITYPDASTDIFLGFISDLGPESIESKKTMRQQVTVQRTGAIAHT